MGVAGELLLSQVYAAKPNSRPDRPLASATSGDIASTTRAPQIWMSWVSELDLEFLILKEAPYKSDERGNSVFSPEAERFGVGRVCTDDAGCPRDPVRTLHTYSCSWVKVLC